MWSKYKILLLPFLFVCFAGFSFLSENPVKLEKTTVSRGFPFPPQKESKTEWTKPTWSTKVSKSYSSFYCSLIKNKMYKPSVYIILFSEQKIFYTSNSFSELKGRAPPLFS